MTTSAVVKRRILTRIQQGASVKNALRLEGHPVEERTVRLWMQERGAGVGARRKPRKRKGKVTEEHFAVLIHWLHQNPRRTYKNMADYLFEEVHHAYTTKQIFGSLKRRHITRKKINVVQLQRDENYRRSFRVRFRSPQLGTFFFLS